MYTKTDLQLSPTGRCTHPNQFRITCPRAIRTGRCYVLPEFVDADFDALIRKIGLLIKFSEDKPEKQSLEFKIHPSPSIDANEAGMKWNICQHPF